MIKQVVDPTIKREVEREVMIKREVDPMINR